MGTPNTDCDVIYVGCWSNKSDTFKTFMEDTTVAAVEDVQGEAPTFVYHGFLSAQQADNFLKMFQNTPTTQTQSRGPFQLLSNRDCAWSPSLHASIKVALTLWMDTFVLSYG